jgi:hypothetical protein
MTAQEWLDAAEARANAAADDASRCYCVTCSSQHDVPALVAALRAVLDMCDGAELEYVPRPSLSTRDIRAAIDTHLGGTS